MKVLTGSGFDVIVIGAGHAGVEAAWAAARLGRSVAICTLSDATVAHMPFDDVETPLFSGVGVTRFVTPPASVTTLMPSDVPTT